MIDRTIKKILDANQQGKFRTDSDIEYFAMANKIGFDEILKCIGNNSPQYRACWGCTHIVNRMYGGTYSACSYCSRRITCDDHFTTDKGRYRMKKEKGKG